MRSSAGRLVNTIRTTTSSPCSSTRVPSSANISRRGLTFARAQVYSPPNAAQVAIDTPASPLDQPLGLKTQSHGKRAYASSSGRPRETQLRSDEQTARDLVDLPPVKLKSTTWMETVDAEAEEVDDWDDPVHFEESEIDHERLDVEAETSAGGPAPDQLLASGNAPNGTRQQGVFVLPGVCTITLRENDIEISLERDKKSPWRQRFSYSRLREACRCVRCRHPSTKQRKWTLGELRDTMRREGWLKGDVASHSARVRGNGAVLRVKWDDHWHPLSIRTLIRHDFAPIAMVPKYLERRIPRIHWSHPTELLGRLAQGRGEDVDNTTPAKIDYRQLFPGNKADEVVLRRMLTEAHQFGFSIISGVPTTQTGDRDCRLRQVAEAIGPIRNTFYGETWDVLSRRDSKNVAYTDLNLGLHMDLLYHTEPPRYQLLHCLKNRVQGGESYFVDGFAAAWKFERIHPDKAELLKQHRLHFEYHNDGHHMENQFPVLPHSLQDLRSAIAWSPPFQGDRRAPPGLADEMFLDAVASFEGYLAEDHRRLEFKMAEGDLVFFDNRRVLHARRAFRNWTDEEKQRMGIDVHAGDEPQRWLKGCYLDGDTVWDKLVTLMSGESARVRKDPNTRTRS